MKKLRSGPTEKRCTACNGTGHLEMVKPAKPNVRIYPAQCRVCLGKGRISENAA
jgi:DnaJ-class molecular chaperone